MQMVFERTQADFSAYDILRAFLSRCQPNNSTRSPTVKWLMRFFDQLRPELGASKIIEHIGSYLLWSGCLTLNPNRFGNRSTF